MDGRVPTQWVMVPRPDRTPCGITTDVPTRTVCSHGECLSVIRLGLAHEAVRPAMGHFLPATDGDCVLDEYEQVGAGSATDEMDCPFSPRSQSPDKDSAACT